jgi:hypothetical protein
MNKKAENYFVCDIFLSNHPESKFYLIFNQGCKKVITLLGDQRGSQIV